ncbi:MAG: hypothetical protein R2940_01045 [Syntrophotaleaceae bacterium]
MILKSLLFVLIVLFAALSSAAAQENSRLCALTRAFECGVNGECGELTIEEMALPRFVRLDLKQNVIVSLDKRVQREDTRIARVQDLGQTTVLQGIEQRGWSIALGKETGTLTLSAAGDGHGFIVFGVCMNP